MSFFFTGDKHADLRGLRDIDCMGQGDYLIIAGDLGLIWNKSALKEKKLYWLNGRPYTTLWVDGNHENHETLDNWDVEEWNGGKIHRIRDNVIHLMRGQIYTIDGFTFFTMGGADSVDKQDRINHVSWWAREMPSYAEYDEGLVNLEKHDNKVDFIVTHTCPEFVLPFTYSYKPSTSIEKYFNQIAGEVKFRYWFFGHHHFDGVVDDKYVGMYHSIMSVNKRGRLYRV